jgi:hypothetical protein
MSLSLYPHFTGDPYKRSFDFVDTVILGSPYDEKFTIENIIKNSNLTELDKDIALHIKSELRRVLKDDLKYIENLPNDSWHLRLTPLGILVKKGGGHLLYLKKLEDRATAEHERQRLNDEKLKYDLKNSKRIFKTYWWTFWFSVISIIYVLVQLILKLIEAIKPQ